jgi:hypothetical protein
MQTRLPFRQPLRFTLALIVLLAFLAITLAAITPSGDFHYWTVSAPKLVLTMVVLSAALLLQITGRLALRTALVQRLPAQLRVPVVSAALIAAAVAVYFTGSYFHLASITVTVS